MRNDIGSIFAIRGYEAPQTIAPSRWQHTFSLCREALLLIAQQEFVRGKTVLLPSYTCQTVLAPFEQEGWTLIHYDVTRDFKIDASSFRAAYDRFRPNVIVVHPYYGMDLTAEELSLLHRCKADGCALIEDITQCIFSTQRDACFDYVVGSLRKWFAIPDGAFADGRIAVPKELPIYESFVSKQMDAMYLRGCYAESEDVQLKEISRRINKSAVSEIAGDPVVPHAIAPFSLATVLAEDPSEQQLRRTENYRYLFEHLAPSAAYRRAVDDLSRLTTAPLYFPIYAEDRAAVQKALIAERIYAPVLWPQPSAAGTHSPQAQWIYDHILVLPCDQRYTKEDMRLMVQILQGV